MRIECPGCNEVQFGLIVVMGNETPFSFRLEDKNYLNFFFRCFPFFPFFIVVQVWLSPFSHHHFPPPYPHPPLSLAMGPLYKFLDSLSHSFPHYSLSLSPLVTVSLFLYFFKFLLLFNYSCMPFLPIPPPHPS